MNINEYKEKKANITFAEEDYGLFSADGFIKGFDCAMNLELAVKFAEWIEKQNNSESLFTKGYDFGTWIVDPSLNNLPKMITTQKLFDYWIENILKI